MTESLGVSTWSSQSFSPVSSRSEARPRCHTALVSLPARTRECSATSRQAPGRASRRPVSAAPVFLVRVQSPLGDALECHAAGETALPAHEASDSSALPPGGGEATGDTLIQEAETPVQKKAVFCQLSSLAD